MDRAWSHDGRGAAVFAGHGAAFELPLQVLAAEARQLERRVADWDGSPFTSDSTSHVSVWRRHLT